MCDVARPDSPIPNSAAQGYDERNRQQHGGETITEASVERRRDRLRQRRIEKAFDAERQLPDDAAQRVDHGGDSGIGRPHQRQALLDGTQACLAQKITAYFEDEYGRRLPGGSRRRP